MAWMAAGSAFGIAWAGGAVGSVPMTEPALLNLLRFMAVMKGALALAAGAAMVWRSRRPIRGGVRFAYGVAIASLAAGPVPIWAGTHIWAGALLVHGGLLLWAITAWRDRAGWLSGRRLIA